MRIYDFGIVLLLVMLGWMAYGVSQPDDRKTNDIMAMCEERDNDIFIYNGLLIDCNKEN